jgi:alanyl-tRNA synthetase
MYVTVFIGNAAVPFDAESYDIWHKEIGIPAERIRRFGMEDN